MDQRLESQDPHLPQTLPLKSLAELLQWKPDDPFNIASVPLQQRPIPKNQNDLCQVIVCHDMMGGYVEDNLVQGSNQNVLYTLRHWQLVDIFVYFSHHRITIPPPAWTNAAHRNGVKVLGTFIAEWDLGMEDMLLLLDTFTLGPDGKKIFSFVPRLVEVAEYYKFDGWLVNIEVALKSSERARDMCDFVSQLTEATHQRIPHSLVIWYDSVTRQGDLAWQDQLNDENCMFFDACDGLFSNYCWKATFPSTSAERAGTRKREVFMGCDIFGRNTFGGGGHNAHKALKVISEAQTSVALFAPAWTYENFPRDEHEAVDWKLWMGATGQGEDDVGCIVDYVRPRPCPSEEGLYCNFDRGFGQALYLNGKLMRLGEFGHIHRQSVQPTWFPRHYPGLTFSHSTDSAFNGGTSLKVTFQGSVAPTLSYIKLFSVRIPCCPGLRAQLVATPFRLSTTQASLRFTLSNGTIMETTGSEAHDLNGWRILNYVLTENIGKEELSVSEIGLVIEHQDTAEEDFCLLGEIRVFHPIDGLELNQDNTFKAARQVISNGRVEDRILGGDNQKISFTVVWDIADAKAWSHFNVYLGAEFLGTSFCDRYRVSGASHTLDGCVITVQPVSRHGFAQESSSCLIIQV